jgi:hypothetical protein
MVEIRDARPDDLRFVADLYNSLVLTTTVAWTDVRRRRLVLDARDY